MPVQFELDRLPVELVNEVLHKTTPKSFVRLCRTTKYLLEVGHYCRNEIAFPVEQMKYIALTREQEAEVSKFTRRYTARPEDLQPFRFVYGLLIIYINPEASSLDYFCTLVKAGKMRFKAVEIEGVCEWHKEEFARYLEVLKPERLTIYGRITKARLPAELFNEVKSLRFPSSDYGDEELLQFSQRRLDIQCPDVTSRGINEFLKQWYRGERELSEIYLNDTADLSPDAVVKDLPANEFYSVDSHHDSLLYMLDPEFSSVSDRSYFILFKSENVFQQFVLVVYKNSIELKSWRDPVAFLMNQLSWDDYNLMAKSYPDWRFLPHKE